MRFASRHLSGEGAPAHEADDFNQHDQNEEGQGDHKDGNLRVSLTCDVGRTGRADTCSQGSNGAEQGSACAQNGPKADTLASAGRGFVHGIDVAILVSMR